MVHCSSKKVGAAKLKYNLTAIFFMSKVVIGKASDVQQGKLTHVSAGGKEILITMINGKYYAMGNICNHAGAELHEGELNGKELRCPWHGAKWDITTGNLIWFPQELKSEESYKVIVDDDTLFLEI
jgi:nitrite reductase/ring-hydroxylating ferredoxin subunit